MYALIKTEESPQFATSMEMVSDGYHTFRELYEFRKLYHASYANLVYFYEQQYGGTEKPIKSWRHSDGELCFGGGWFVVTQQLPTGQITNHYAEGDWDLFKIPEVDKAPEWDGHTAADVADRLQKAIEPLTGEHNTSQQASPEGGR